MKYKSGDIIFLTRRTSGSFIRKLISKGIAFFTKHKNQSLSKVKVHAAIIYFYKNSLFVREMDKDGVIHTPLNKYIENNKNRIEIYQHKFININYSNFNESCKNLNVKYDYENTFFWQIIQSIFHIFIGHQTKYERMCAEDVQRQFNLIKKIFLLPERTSPNTLYYICKNSKHFF